ncbi:MAG TPA: hypothetical protein VGU20_21240 [Stellaceae bacterium]|nr:hypothetical protein [Stellaceae bacterium]
MTLLVLAVYFPEPTPFQYLVFRIVLTAAASGFAAFVPGFLQIEYKNVVRAGGALGIFVIVYFFSPAALVSEATHAPTGDQISLLSECRMSSLPISIPPHGVLHLVPLNSRRLKAVKWGLYDVHNDQGDAKAWPTEDQLNLAKQQHDPGVFVYRCDLSNHGRSNILNVAIPMRFWFGNEGGEANALHYSAVVSPLDAGETFVFYLVNDCPVHASGVVPDTARIKIGGESAWRDVPLNRTYKNPVEQIMMFFPTKVRWIGGEPCE